jgi:small GTP-binding protein
MTATRAILIGDVQVGKSLLAERLLKRNDYREKVTVPVAWYNIDFEQDGEKRLIELVDTAGQETFRALAPTYYRNARIALMVFDQTRRSSFDNLIREWAGLVAQYAPPNVIKFIIGNKEDLESCGITDDEIAETVQRINAEDSFKTSALNNIGVDELLDKLKETAGRPTPVSAVPIGRPLVAPGQAEPGCNC